MKHSLSGITVLLACLVALPATATASRAQRLAQFQKFAGAPVAQIRYFHLDGFETLSDDTIAVWTGVNRVYLIKLRVCPELDYADTISLSGSPTHQFTQRFGTVNVGRSRCMVESIRPVDYKAMQRAGKASDPEPGP